MGLLPYPFQVQDLTTATKRERDPADERSTYDSNSAARRVRPDSFSFKILGSHSDEWKGESS